MKLDKIIKSNDCRICSIDNTDSMRLSFHGYVIYAMCIHAFICLQFFFLFKQLGVII